MIPRLVESNLSYFRSDSESGVKNLTHINKERYAEELKKQAHTGQQNTQQRMSTHLS